MLCIEESFESCKINIEEKIKLSETLGLIINYKKSILTPTKVCECLGWEINSNDFTVQLTKPKKQKLSSLLKTFVTKNKCSIREFAEFIGKLVAASQGVEYGLLYTRALERQKITALRIHNGNFNKIMEIPRSILPDIRWWISNINKAKKAIKLQNYVLEINTDASNTGWGATDGRSKVFGFWEGKELLWHINYKELKAVALALQKIAADARNCEILLRIDNTTAISYINNLGGVRYKTYHELAKQIWQWAEQRNVFLYASYIPSSENTEADGLSRIKNVDIE